MSTATAGLMPEVGITTSKYFSAPRSAPNPVSFTTNSARFNAMRCEMTLLVPWAMFANGPACTSAGVPSVVWTRLGMIASFSSTIMPPVAFRSAVRTGCPSIV